MAWQTNTGDTAPNTDTGSLPIPTRCCYSRRCGEAAVEHQDHSTEGPTLPHKESPIPPSVISAAVIRCTALTLNWRLVRRWEERPGPMGIRVMGAEGADREARVSGPLAPPAQEDLT